MNTIRKITFIITTLFIIGVTSANAQDKEIETDISADIVSQYIWRGQDLGDVSLQPTLGVSYKGLSLTSWGSVGLKSIDEAKELDLTLAYTTGGFNIGITDYWFNAGGDPKNRYFKYDSHSTNHVFEANIGYDFDKFSLQWYTNIAGNDGYNKKGKRAYSSYFDVNVPFKLFTCDWSATLGVVPYATDFYNVNKFSVINVAVQATKDIKITDSFTIPIFASIATNPHDQKAYLIFGLQLHP
ncbi:MAG: hypothetical protein J5805_06155 [Bacteroidaceae bacterium]|nr:hypothetical protein [Bacteroidaceae bacterium]